MKLFSLIDLALHWLNWQYIEFIDKLKCEKFSLIDDFSFAIHFQLFFVDFKLKQLTQRMSWVIIFKEGQIRYFWKLQLILELLSKEVRIPLKTLTWQQQQQIMLLRAENSSTKTDPLFWCCKVTALLNEKAIFFKFIFNDLFLCHNIHRVAKDSKVCSLAQVLLPSFPTVFENYKNVSWFTTKILSETFLWVFKHH